MRKAITSVLIVLSLVGCSVVGDSIERGHMFAQSGDYRAALAQYQRALRLDPDHEEAKSHVAQMRPFAIQAAQDDARHELAAGRYERAMEHARYIRSIAPSGVEAGAIEAAIEQSMAAELDNLLGAERMEEAYPLAVRAAHLRPAMPSLPQTFARLRTHFYTRSDARLQAGDHAEALASLAVVRRHEPHLDADLRPRERRVREAWADHVAERARQAEAEGELGAAAALFARAFEIAGREAEREAMGKLAGDLRDEGTFRLRLHPEGTPARAERIGRLTRVKAAALSGVVLVDLPGGETMVAELAVPPGRCAESATPEPREQPYVAGTRQDENPAHAQLALQLERQQRELRRLTDERAEQARALGLVVRDARRCEAELTGVERTLASARAALDRVEQSVARQRERVDALEAELADMQRHGAPPRLQAAVRRRLEQARSALAREEDKGRAALQAGLQAERARDELAVRCMPVATAATTAQSRLSSLEGDIRQAEDARAALAHRLAATPPTVTVELIDTFHYEAASWTRRCEADLRYTLEPAWDQPETGEVSEARQTHDVSHPAYPRYGVSFDPLQYPRDDDDLLTEADGTLAAALSERIGNRVRDYYAFMSEQALRLAREGEPDEATTYMIALELAAPQQLPELSRRAFAAHLRERYGLQDPALLRR